MIKRRYTRAGKVAAIISPHLDDRQTVTTTVLEQTTGEESGGAVQNVNVVTETLAAATHRGDQIFGAEKMAKFNNKGELGASLLRAGRDDKTRSVNAEDWHENAAAIFKNTIAFLGKDRGAAFIRAYGSLLEIAASDPDGFGKAMVSVGRNVFFADGNLGIGTVPAAPLHVAKTGDQVVLEDGDGSTTRLRSDAGGFTATPENGVSTFSGKIVSAEPDGTTTTLSAGGVVRESGITEGYYQKRGVVFEGDKTTAQAHSIDGQAQVVLRALKGYLPDAESSDHPYIDVYSADKFYTTPGGVSIHAPQITLDPGEGGINGDLNFTGNATFSDVVLPANTGMGWNRTGHLKIAVSSGAPTSPEDGQIWVTNDGVFVRVNGVTRDLVDSGESAPPPLPELPPPHVKLENGASQSANGKDGNPISCTRRVFVEIKGMPEIYFSPQYGLQVFLFRHVRPRWGHKKPGIQNSATKRKAEMVHPKYVDNGATQTEFSFLTNEAGATIEIPLQAFTRWFERATYENGTSSITSLAYRSSAKAKTYLPLLRGKRNMTTNIVRGRFEFRYSVINPVDGKRVLSAPSRMIVAAPGVSPTRPLSDYELEPNPNADNRFDIKMNFA